MTAVGGSIFTVGRKMRKRKSRKIKSLPRYLDRLKRFQHGDISTMRYPSSDFRAKAMANLSCSREDRIECNKVMDAML